MIVKVFILVVIVTSYLLLTNVAARKPFRPKRCNETERSQRCRTLFCARFPNTTCTYAEYKREYCKCCPKCPYPPPSTIKCPKRKPKEPKLCSKAIRESCTPDQYIKELCKICRHCPYPNQSPGDLDPCFSSPCPQGKDCMNDPKECITTPCDQFVCKPRDGGNVDPCFGNPCPPGQNCVNSPKQCVTVPCPQYGCVQQNPCETIKCKEGYICVARQCWGWNCQPMGQCVPSPQGQCPSTAGQVSDCVFTDCTNSGCNTGLIQDSCPKACGGTHCVSPV